MKVEITIENTSPKKSDVLLFYSATSRTSANWKNNANIAINCKFLDAANPPLCEPNTNHYQELLAMSESLTLKAVLVNPDEFFSHVADFECVEHVGNLSVLPLTKQSIAVKQISLTPLTRMKFSLLGNKKVTAIFNVFEVQ